MQGNTEAYPDRLRAFWLHAFNSMAQKVIWKVQVGQYDELFFFLSCNSRFTVYSEYQPCYELLHTRYYSLIYPLFIYWCAVGYLISTLKDGEKTDKNTPGPLFFLSFRFFLRFNYHINICIRIHRKTSRNKAWRRYVVVRHSEDLICWNYHCFVPYVIPCNRRERVHVLENEQTAATIRIKRLRRRQ